MKLSSRIVLGVAVLLCVSDAVAQAPGKRIVVEKSASSALPLDMSDFKAGSGAEAALFRSTLEADLTRWGWFELAPRGGGAVAIAGNCAASGNDLAVAFNVYGTVSRQSYLSRSFSESKADARRFAHRVADMIVEAVTRRKGVASTRIVMVGAATGTKELYLCDSDGQNMRRLTTDRTISLAPKWGPDGETVVYTSFLSRFPDLYLIKISTGHRQRVAGYPGLNTGGDISPDGRAVAAVLSKDGNPDIYLVDLHGSRPTRVTRTKNAPVACPTWSPDGQQIAFVSGTAGLPHVYVVSRSGGERRRVTFRGNENVDPDWGPSGLIAYSSKRFGRYQICVLDPRTMADEQQLTQEFVDHLDPSWAADGRHIVYTRTDGFRSQVYILDTVGGRQIRLTNLAGDWTSPAWSPK